MWIDTVRVVVVLGLRFLVEVFPPIAHSAMEIVVATVWIKVEVEFFGAGAVPLPAGLPLSFVVTLMSLTPPVVVAPAVGPAIIGFLGFAS